MLLKVRATSAPDDADQHQRAEGGEQQDELDDRAPAEQQVHGDEGKDVPVEVIAEVVAVGVDEADVTAEKR
jgi:hypothetical protein